MWKRSLDTVEQAISLGSFHYEAALAAVETLGVMLQITSEAGFVPNNRMRASAGMRVINGALQQDDYGRHRYGGNTGGQQSSAEDEVLSLQYEQVKQDYWMQAWNTMQSAIQNITADDEGEVCLALAKCLKNLYASMADKEFRYSQHVKSLLRAAKYLVRERNSSANSAAPACKKYKLSMSFAQREVMSMLQAIRPADAPTCSALLVTLAELATASGLASQDAEVAGATSPVAFTVSKEFRDLAMQALTTLLLHGMSTGDQQGEAGVASRETARIPSAAKTLAFVEMMSVPGRICLQHLRTRSRWLAAREALGNAKPIVRTVSSSTMLTSLQLTQGPGATPISSPTRRAAGERQGVMGVLSAVMGWWYAPPTSSEHGDSEDEKEEQEGEQQQPQEQQEQGSTAVAVPEPVVDGGCSATSNFFLLPRV